MRLHSHDVRRGGKGGRKRIVSFEIPNCIFGSIDGFFASGSKQVRGMIIDEEDNERMNQIPCFVQW